MGPCTNKEAKSTDQLMVNPYPYVSERKPSC